KKADIVYVNTELAKKADTSYVNTELDKKADISYVDSGLESKADKSYVQEGLDSKADKNNAVLTGTPRLPAPGSVRFGSNTLAELLDRKADGDDVGDKITIINDRLHFLDLEILKKADQSYVDLELDKKAPLDNPSFTGDVTIGKRAYWEKEYQVSNTVHAELTAENDNPLDPTKVYRVQLVTRNTSTSAGANYIIYANKQGQWSVRYTSRSGSSGNHPRLLVNDNKVYVATFHTDLQTVRVIGETFDVGEIGASPNFFGPEVGFQVDGTTVRVADNRNLDVAGALNASTLRQGGVALSSLFKDISYVPAWSEITSKPTTVSGFGITDAYTKTQVDTELGKKADTTYVNTERGKKADIFYVDSELNKKADQDEVDAELAKKADIVYVDTELNKKADQDEVDAELAKKADIFYVDTELGKKADTTYVNTELGKKADITYVDN